MMKKVIAGIGLAAAAGVSGIYAATSPGEIAQKNGSAPVTTTQQLNADTITCPLTGEDIPPCCCPLNKGD